MYQISPAPCITYNESPTKVAINQTLSINKFKRQLYGSNLNASPVKDLIKLQIMHIVIKLIVTYSYENPKNKW
jgi:hypothetical protein